MSVSSLRGTLCLRGSLRSAVPSIVPERCIFSPPGTSGLNLSLSAYFTLSFPYHKTTGHRSPWSSREAAPVGCSCHRSRSGSGSAAAQDSCCLQKCGCDTKFLSYKFAYNRRQILHDVKSSTTLPNLLCFLRVCCAGHSARDTRAVCLLPGARSWVGSKDNETWLGRVQ